MEQILSYFVFDTVGIVGLSTLSLFFLIQVFFYFTYYKRPIKELKYIEKNSDRNKLPSVSVIIVAKNESENLAKNLPAILNQDYPDYEVIVVNDGSTDESELLLKQLKFEYPHLYNTFSPISYENQSRRQKILSLTIGIKAATKDILLFTEADAAPIDKGWITSMMEHLTPDKDIVLGYCNFNTSQRIWSNVSLYDHLLFSLQYFSKALKKKPFAGVSRNVAYRKHLFFDNKGFSSALKFESAEDIFLNNIMTDVNTAVALSQSSFVSSELESFSKWKFIKTSYLKARKHFMNFRPSIFHLESFSRYLFYGLFIVAVIYTSNMFLWTYLAGFTLLFVLRFLMQYFILKKASNYFMKRHYLFLLPILDLLQPFYNFIFLQYSKAKVKRKK